MIRILGLHSPAPQSGKSTVARHLAARGYIVLPFAQPMKAVARYALATVGVAERDIDAALAGDKSAVVYNGVTMRRVLQTLGTEWGREVLGPQVWVDAWRRALNDLPRGQLVVADDVRFPNEAQAIRDLGGQVWSIVRPGAPVGPAHASEGQRIAIDRYLLNDTDVDSLLAQADAWLGSL